jgi:hypothetical protein
LLRALGTKNDARYNLKIINNDGFEGKEKADDTAADDSFASDEEATEETSELAKKTRQELADLDDLDI